MRLPISSLAVLAATLCSSPDFARATTLEQLSMQRLIDESTEIVRGTVTYCNSLYKPPMIYTVCEVNVVERLKGAPAARVLVAIPGGVAAGYRQTFEGVPTLARNSEYLLFLWQGKNGLKQIMGLSQGLMTVGKDEKGNIVVQRAQSEERMLNPAGEAVKDRTLSMRLGDLAGTIRTRVKSR